MAETAVRSIRLMPEDDAIVERLGRLWGGLRTLDRSAVIREALRRANAAEPPEPELPEASPAKPKRRKPR